MPIYPKTAACLCGALSVSVVAEPRTVHACSCLDCQRRSGSAMSYTAFFAEAVASAKGESRSWRRVADSGRWKDAHFCPTCGCMVFMRLQALPDAIAIPVGCFADEDFAKPGRLYWASRRHRWLATPPEMDLVETQ